MKSSLLGVTILLLEISCRVYCGWSESNDPCQSVRFVGREKWQARDPVDQDFMAGPAKYAMVSNTKTQVCASEGQCSQFVNKIQELHMGRLNLTDIGYNFVVAGDGKTYEGRGGNVTVELDLDSGDQTLVIGVISNGNVFPTNRMWSSVKHILLCSVHKGFLSADYELHADPEEDCDSSLSLRLHKILLHDHNPADGQVPSFVCETRVN